MVQCIAVLISSVLTRPCMRQNRGTLSKHIIYLECYMTLDKKLQIFQARYYTLIRVNSALDIFPAYWAANLRAIKVGKNSSAPLGFDSWRAGSGPNMIKCFKEFLNQTLCKYYVVESQQLGSLSSLLKFTRNPNALPVKAAPSSQRTWYVWGYMVQWENRVIDVMRFNMNIRSSWDVFVNIGFS